MYTREGNDELAYQIEGGIIYCSRDIIVWTKSPFKIIGKVKPASCARVGQGKFYQFKCQRSYKENQGGIYRVAEMLSGQKLHPEFCVKGCT